MDVALGAAIDPEREEVFRQMSSFIGTVTYSIDLQSLEIQIGSRVYPYCSVPHRVFESFQGSGSKGAFFNREIKGIYEC